MAAVWRLLRDGAGPGPWNMGVDEALLASAAAGGPPTLRLYAWDAAWLSLGYGQTLAPERAARCRAAGVGSVRRTTGGAAVLHGADLTYAVAAPEAALPAGLRATYAAIAEALAAALAELGVVVDRAPPPPPRAGRAFDCFAEPAADELAVAGAKLAGSAQRRAEGAVLQHGSLRIGPDPAPARAAAGLSGRATSLRELGCDASREVLEAALVAAFGRTFGVALRADTASPEERARAGCRGIDPLPRPSEDAPPGISRVPSAGR